MNVRPRLQRLLACIADPSRFRLLKALLEGDHCVSEIARRVGLSQSCTTRHLQTLQRERVVTRTRAGKRVFFRLADGQPEVARVLELAFLRAPLEAALAEPGSRVVSEAARPAKASRERQRRARQPDGPRDARSSDAPRGLEAPVAASGDAGEDAGQAPERQSWADLEDFLL